MSDRACGHNDSDCFHCIKCHRTDVDDLCAKLDIAVKALEELKPIEGVISVTITTKRDDD